MLFRSLSGGMIESSSRLSEFRRNSVCQRLLRCGERQSYRPGPWRQKHLEGWVPGDRGESEYSALFSVLSASTSVLESNRLRF